MHATRLISARTVAVWSTRSPRNIVVLLVTLILVSYMALGFSIPVCLVSEFGSVWIAAPAICAVLAPLELLLAARTVLHPIQTLVASLLLMTY